MLTALIRVWIRHRADEVDAVLSAFGHAADNGLSVTQIEARNAA